MESNGDLNSRLTLKEPKLDARGILSSRPSLLDRGLIINQNLYKKEILYSRLTLNEPKLDLILNQQPSNTRFPLLIASFDRHTTEDLQFGKNADTSFIKPQSLVKETDNQLFDRMKNLFSNLNTIGPLRDAIGKIDNDLLDLSSMMIQRFKDRKGGQFRHEILNKKVLESAEFETFRKNFQQDLNSRLRTVQGDIKKVLPIKLSNYRPLFDATFGLKILLNDTEKTEIYLHSFSITKSKKWHATVSMTIGDHFGLDKHDVLKYQDYLYLNKGGAPLDGFPSWWLLQHTRNYIPFETIINVKAELNGQL
jgi:hypothetical protein